MGEGAPTERRRAPRTTLGLPVTLHGSSPNAQPAMAMMCDLSELGASVVGPASFQVGDVVLVMITRGEFTIDQLGLVVGWDDRGDDTALLNIAFKTPSEEDRLALRQMIDPS